LGAWENDMKKWLMKSLLVISISVTGYLMQACDPGTGMRFREHLSQPIPNVCEESALKIKNLSYKNNESSRDKLSSYSFSNDEFSGSIYQS
jgi:hypothetical protein